MSPDWIGTGKVRAREAGQGVEITIDGRLVFSKLDSGGFPSDAEIDAFAEILAQTGATP